MSKIIEKEEATTNTSRRQLLQNFVGLAGIAVAAGAPIARKASNASAQTPVYTIQQDAAQVTAVDGDQDPLERMRADLARAMQKPEAERRWVMVIDLRKCVGCNACTISCVAENHLPPGVVYRPVLEEEIGTFPNVTKRFLPRPCMQCDNPPCVPVCPVNATWKRDDGIVTIDYDKCIGCRYCITACPYNARTFDKGLTYNLENLQGVPAGALVGTLDAEQYELAAAHEYGEERPRAEGKSPVGNARKCHFCLHRLEKGMLPACTTTCIGRATYFGDANDPDSLVAELIASPNVMRLKEELGTEPKVFYLQ
jgi:molybdopterin-containing oxidoreductase family iron-sulfur binding subunit